MKYAPFLLILVLIGALAVSCRENSGWSVWEAQKDTVFAGVDSAQYLRGLEERDSLQRFIAEHLGLAERESSAAKYLTGVSRAYRSVSDSLGRLLPALQTTAESLQVTVGRVEALGVSLDSLEAAQARTEAARGLLLLAIEGLVQDTIRLHISDSAGWASVTKLQSLVRSVPGPCRIGPLPCPQVVVGYGAVLSGGVVRMGPSVSVGLRIPF